MRAVRVCAYSSKHQPLSVLLRCRVRELLFRLFVSITAAVTAQHTSATQDLLKNISRAPTVSSSL